ncbi:hypothetical protein FK220_007980 [Flavobacteriaceae bacterium TP-CH-4]|uniref:Uncharacterized protein n=1 Tax=Pelagihabitans pacificus TaxID=2696054 RepID=A0A967ASG9_9FLAO|nr:hypothetical protein [Pelagihabitans pacificus]NHF59274.1 hypothetical protein [Pelagihabitans pacificus]
MKKVVLIAAVVLMNVGLYSCEKENTIDETQALYENLEISANDDDSSETDDREDPNN